MPSSHPTFDNGKICYVEIPTTDIQHSAAFYEKVFGWTIRRNDEDNVSFDDGVGEVSGMWVLGRQPLGQNSLMISIMVDSIETTSDLVIANGGKIIQRADRSAPFIAALFSDPAGNTMCLYQHGS